MRRYDRRDLLGGGILALAGLAATGYALLTMRVGTVANMGPGMFPAAAGLVLAVFGAIIAVGGLSREGALPPPDTRPFFMILGSIALFSIVIGSFGLIPAVAIQTLVSSAADNKLSLLASAVLSIVLIVGASLIFVVALGLPIPLIKWPW